MSTIPASPASTSPSVPPPTSALEDTTPTSLPPPPPHHNHQGTTTTIPQSSTNPTTIANDPSSSASPNDSNTNTPPPPQTQTTTPNTSTQSPIGKQTLSPSGSALTLSETTYSLALAPTSLAPLSPSSSPVLTPILVINGATQTQSQSQAPPSPPTGAVLVLGSTTLTANSASQFTFGTQTLAPGGPAVTVAGVTLSLPVGDGDVVVVDGATMTAGGYYATVTGGGGSGAAAGTGTGTGSLTVVASSSRGGASYVPITLTGNAAVRVGGAGRKMLGVVVAAVVAGVAAFS
jgi:hypothetical protein